MKSKPYNGHKNWTHWNVALWLGNDEPTYRSAVDIYRSFPTVAGAARYMQRQLPERTPDGARYSLSALRAALTGLEIER